MKRLLVGMIAGLLVTPARQVTVTSLQEPIPIRQAPTLTAAEIVSILADYDVLHRDQQPFFMPAYGVTNFDSNPPAVWIFNTGDTPSKRSTVIHEFLHVK